DKDLMQLVNDRVMMLDPIKNRPIGAAEVREKFGVGPDRVIDVQALCGDSVDNVPGVPGIGVKTAAELINTYGDLATLLAMASEIPPFTAPRTYALVQTVEGLDHWIEAAQQAGAVAIWPEASILAGTRPALAGIALALAPGLAAYVPVGHRRPSAAEPIPTLP